MWNSGIESDKTTVRQRKRNLKYIANILVVSDPSSPSSEGEVKLYRFGKKIFDKIMDSMQPQFPDEKPVNPFDMWEGADFVLKIRKVEGYPNYDASSFKSPSAVSSDETHLEDMYNKQYDLTEWTDPKNYKQYDELQKRLVMVLGETTPTSAPKRVASQIELDDEVESFTPRSAEPSQQYASTAPKTISTAESAMDDDDTMSYFAKLANDD